MGGWKGAASRGWPGPRARNTWSRTETCCCSLQQLGGGSLKLPPGLYFAPHNPILPGARTGPGRLQPKEGVMTRQYEVVYIFDSVLEETAINERLARFHTLIHQDSVEPPQVSQWGKRTLAYPIKHDTGYYVVAKFEADATALPVRARDQARRRRAAVPRGGQRGRPAGAGDRGQERRGERRMRRPRRPAPSASRVCAWWITRTSARCRASSPSAGRFCPAGSRAPAPGINGS